MEASMNAAFSFQISIGIIAFGIWIAAGTIGGSSPLAWAFMGLLTAIVRRHAQSSSAEKDDRPNADA
jgi:hypothetical protein